MIFNPIFLPKLKCVGLSSTRKKGNFYLRKNLSVNREIKQQNWHFSIFRTFGFLIQGLKIFFLNPINNYKYEMVGSDIGWKNWIYNRTDVWVGISRKINTHSSFWTFRAYKILIENLIEKVFLQSIFSAQTLCFQLRPWLMKTCL